MTMQIGVSVSIPASLRVRTTPAPPACRVCCRTCCWSAGYRDASRGPRVLDMSRPLRRPSSPAHRHGLRDPRPQALRNQSRTCLSSGPSVSRRSAFGRGAEFCGFVDGVPEPGESICRLRRFVIKLFRIQEPRAPGPFWVDAPAAESITALPRAGGCELARARPRRCGGKEPARRNVSSGICRLVDSNCAASYFVLMIAVGITATPRPSIAMRMTASEALACSRIGGRSGRLNIERTSS